MIHWKEAPCYMIAFHIKVCAMVAPAHLMFSLSCSIKCKVPNLLGGKSRVTPDCHMRNWCHPYTTLDLALLLKMYYSPWNDVVGEWLGFWWLDFFACCVFTPFQCLNTQQYISPSGTKNSNLESKEAITNKPSRKYTTNDYWQTYSINPHQKAMAISCWVYRENTSVQ